MHNSFSNLYQSQIKTFIRQAILEDLGAGDVTSTACFDTPATGSAKCLIKEAGILAGIEMAKSIFYEIDSELEFTPLKKDGSPIAPGDVVFTVSGNQISLLSAERLVLNCMQRMSAIATLTHRVQHQISHTACKVLDTRKTTPNFRIAEKWAVHIGGGTNHRMGLYDMIMLKNNHIDYCGGIKNAIQKTITHLESRQLSIPIIVEARNLDEVAACLPYAQHIERILLDNMSAPVLVESLRLIDGILPTEASGNITKDNVVPIAETGVNYVSMGSIIYSAGVLDMSLRAV
jgi:nicotinate-nucleotide pyrophosphorylase (carboxylating)